MLELIEPTADLYTAFRDSRADWGPGIHEDGFGIDEKDDVDSPDGFVTWVRRMLSQLHPTAQPCPDQPHWALGTVLAEARDVLGLNRALMICAEDNIASTRTIERCGGVLEEVRTTKLGPQRRYWFDLA
jgi:hypothetical protein